MRRLAAVTLCLLAGSDAAFGQTPILEVKPDDGAWTSNPGTMLVHTKVRLNQAQEATWFLPYFRLVVGAPSQEFIDTFGDPGAGTTPFDEIRDADVAWNGTTVFDGVVGVDPSQIESDFDHIFPGVGAPQDEKEDNVKDLYQAVLGGNTRATLRFDPSTWSQSRIRTWRQLIYTDDSDNRDPDEVPKLFAASEILISCILQQLDDPAMSDLLLNGTNSNGDPWIDRLLNAMAPRFDFQAVYLRSTDVDATGGFTPEATDGLIGSNGTPMSYVGAPEISITVPLSIDVFLVLGDEGSQHPLLSAGPEARLAYVNPIAGQPFTTVEVELSASFGDPRLRLNLGNHIMVLTLTRIGQETNRFLCVVPNIAAARYEFLVSTDYGVSTPGLPGETFDDFWVQ